LRLLDVCDFRRAILVAAAQLDDVHNRVVHRPTPFHTRGQLDHSCAHRIFPGGLDVRLRHIEPLYDDRISGEDSHAGAYVDHRRPTRPPRLGDVPAHGRLRSGVTSRVWNLNLASDDPRKRRGPSSIDSTKDNRLCFGWSKPAPNPKLEIVGTRPQIPQIAKRRSATPACREVDQRWFGRGAHDFRLAEALPCEQNGYGERKKNEARHRRCLRDHRQRMTNVLRSRVQLVAQELEVADDCRRRRHRANAECVEEVGDEAGRQQRGRWRDVHARGTLPRDRRPQHDDEVHCESAKCTEQDDLWVHLEFSGGGRIAITKYATQCSSRRRSTLISRANAFRSTPSSDLRS
jgi:hypothetical protein